MAGMKDSLLTFLAMASILVGLLFLVTFCATNFFQVFGEAIPGVALVAAGATRIWMTSVFYRR
jgi:hypothetical protein